MDTAQPHFSAMLNIQDDEMEEDEPLSNLKTMLTGADEEEEDEPLPHRL